MHAVSTVITISVRVLLAAINFSMHDKLTFNVCKKEESGFGGGRKGRRKMRGRKGLRYGGRKIGRERRWRKGRGKKKGKGI